jgi:hypothetical protein
MRTSSKRGSEPEVRKQRKYTAEERASIFHGCPVTTLAEIFRQKRQNIERKLRGCPVAAVNPDGNPLYDIAEAARFLVRVRLTDKQVRETIIRMDPKDFPPMTSKIFWEGLVQRRKYEEQIGELWHTSDVAKVLADSFNAVRMSLLLLPDTLVETAGLNEKQRVTVRDIMDSALEGLENALVTELRKPSGSGPEPSSEEGEL